MALHSLPDPVGRSIRWLTITSCLEAVADGVARTALPIVAVAVLGVGTATVGAINSVGLIAFLLLSIPIGALADRLSAPVRFMSASTLARAAVMVLGVTAWGSGLLEGGWGLVVVLVMALVTGVADVVYTAGQGLLVPLMVPKDGIRLAFGRVQAASQAGAAAGPLVLTGVLVLFAAPVAWAASGLLYLASLFTQGRIVGTAPGGSPRPGRRPSREQVAGNLGMLFRVPVLARITVSNALNNVAVMGANTLLPVIALNELGVGPASYAAIGTVGAVVGVVGAAVAPEVTARLGLQVTRLVTATMGVTGSMLVILVMPNAGVLPGPAVAWLVLQSTLSGAAASIAMVAGSDLIPRLVPSENMGAIMGAQRTIVLGVMPMAAVGFGALGEFSLIAAAGTWLCCAAASAIPCLGLRDGGGASA